MDKMTVNVPPKLFQKLGKGLIKAMEKLTNLMSFNQEIRDVSEQKGASIG